MAMSFVPPTPDLQKIIAAWESWERGEEQPGKTIASLKTAGLDVILRDLVASGWAPVSK
ncbi:hypothetical protein LBMAG16_00290 [Actinomycetes bacterium]|nr:hypothetical protein LBMAG16_00290 [Actinomycetes bacterium]